MARVVTLKSRLPAIAAELRPRVAQGVKTAAEVVMEDAIRRVDLGPPPEHIIEAIRVRRYEAAGYLVEVPITDEKGFPYPFALEYGSVTAPAYPFLVPALEANEDNAVYLVTGALRGL
jgi:hypothetical protein